MIKRKTIKNHMKNILLSLIIISVLLPLSGCGAASKSATSADKASSSAGSAPNTVKSEEKTSSAADTSTTSNSTSISPGYKITQTAHRIIQTGRMNMETTTFDETLSQVQNYVNSIGGYIQSSSIQGRGITPDNSTSNRVGTLTFRVPQNKYSEFFTSAKSYGTITFQENTGEDVTEQYFDTEARVKALTIQEERILDILKKSDKLSDVIELEKHLSDIRYQIENLTGTLRKWDNLVNFSTITLQIQEVKEITKVAPESSNGLLKRISYAFTNSIKQLGIFFQAVIVFLFTILPFMLVAIIIALIVLTIIKKYNIIKHNRIDSSHNNLSSNSKDNKDSEDNN
ncbi:hypothetical protein CLHOM_24650 [Clostridium homopropionicum DSM 5847]|uniref:DUF4349 domain-containing protein n=1 Tax=Clostridium homopropionicum DSM 5847 TaxID=1121318 RepID=A0A0L6Z7Z8_9CLOT|nr:DUF4349 domain-containing protein [Clostridium homopropionicum]KOA19084.1 hypothetical protein CLHOM_24650 [Clostridium homopropionicum DSM 5847]SFG83223.1 protein of unknown function [Clostridium homopropionicum]